MSNYLVVAAFTATNGKVRTKSQIATGCSSMRTALAHAIARITQARVNETIHKSALFYAVRLDAQTFEQAKKAVGGTRGHLTRSKSFNEGEVHNLYQQIVDDAAKARQVEKDNAAALLRDLEKKQHATDATKTAAILKEATNGVHQ